MTPAKKEAAMSRRCRGIESGDAEGTVRQRKLSISAGGFAAYRLFEIRAQRLEQGMASE